VLKNFIGTFKQTTNQTNVTTNLEPTPEFKEFFLNANLISLLFSCYELVRDDAEMAHASIQSVIQLSTLNGPMFREDETSQMRVAFFSSFLQIFLTTFTKYVKTNKIKIKLKHSDLILIFFFTKNTNKRTRMV
jgi:hypothetical protein